jgi:hypothetical protein
MKILSKVTSDTLAIIWNITESEVLKTKHFQDLNYLFNNGLVHAFKSDFKTDTPYLFQTQQFDKPLFLMAFKKQDKSIDQLLSDFKDLNLENTESKHILVIDSEKKIKKDNINKNVKNLNPSGFDFIN